MSADKQLPLSPDVLNITTKYINNQRCYLQWGKYSNHRTSLTLFDDKTGEPVMKATVNIPEVDVPLGHILVKGWSENEGIVGCLEKHNLIELITTIPTNHVYANLCKLLVELPA